MPLSSQHIGVFLMGWGAGMLNAVRTKTVVVYCQLYLPVVLGSGARSLMSHVSVSPLSSYGALLYVLASVYFVVIAFQVCQRPLHGVTKRLDPLPPRRRSRSTFRPPALLRAGPCMVTG